MDQIALKAGGFPSPQLMVIRTDAISLDNFLQIGQLAIDQGHYIMGITDKMGKPLKKFKK